MGIRGTFQLNSPRVVCEILEGDAVLVHFESGLYFSVRGVGADICQSLIDGHAVDGIINALTRRYDAAPPSLSSEVEAFIDQLVTQKLFVAAECPKVPQYAAFRSSQYQTPVLETFDDMADQLLLDKIEDETRDAWVKPT